MKSLFKKIGISVASLILGIMLPTFTVSVLAGPSLAGSATSPKGYYTVYGYDYLNYSGITTGISPNNKTYANSWSRAQTSPMSGPTPPAGYIGSKGRLFDENDRLVVETTYVYTTSASNWINSETAGLNPAVSGRAYYGYGITAAYNGDGYTTYYTFKTPSQNAP